MFIYWCTSIQLLWRPAAEHYLLRALQLALPESHQRFPEIVLAVEVGVAHADERA